ncbi:hypothetical protein N7524_010965 [Penicillium chrysogenum]|nr:hypothetical protein N7524_010965 [Penicillium chrysogenum]
MFHYQRRDELPPSLVGHPAPERIKDTTIGLPSIKSCLSDILDNLVPENHWPISPGAPGERQQCHRSVPNISNNYSQAICPTRKKDPERSFHGADPENTQQSPRKKPKYMAAAHPQLPIQPKLASSILPEENHYFDSSQFLASKSNYECIVEGTGSKLGLAYPDHLLTGLDAKRVSHKNAEKDRRDRLSRALQALSELIADNEAESNNSDIVSEVVSLYKEQHGNKVATVEAAVQYIKGLRKELKSEY